MSFKTRELLLDESTLPQEVRNFLSENKPSETKLNPLDSYEIVGIPLNHNMLAGNNNKVKLELIEIIAALGKCDHLGAILKNKAAEQLIAANDNSALCLAVRNGHEKMVEQLLAYKAVKEKITADNNRALVVAAQEGYILIVQNLLTYDAVKGAVAIEYNLALRSAARNGHDKVVSLLLTYEAVKQDVAILDNRALSTAALFGHDKVVSLLLTHNAVKQNVAINNNIALRGAAQNGHDKVVALLLTYDAVKQAVAINNNFSLRAAIQNVHDKVVQLLLNYAKVFSFAEMQGNEYVNYTREFIDEKFKALYAVKKAAEEKHAKKVFDLSGEEEAKVCFYMIRNLIRRNPSPSRNVLDRIHFLLAIPAVRNLADKVVLNGRKNELLRLAINLNNKDARDILLTIPAVSSLAAENNNYEEEKDQPDLGLIAQNAESSMKAFSAEEEKRLQKGIDRYKPMTQQMGNMVILGDLYARLAKRYETNPVKIQVGDKEISLPLTWADFQRLKLDEDTEKKALEGYYSNPNHSAYRYLSKPNPWMHPDAEFVNGDPRIHAGWSNFEDYKNEIAMFYLAAIDQEIKPSDGFTDESRLEHFIYVFSQIARAHNWDNTRVNKNGKDEEYDDMEGDRPSCPLGVKRRLLQSGQGNALFAVLNENIIFCELRDFCTQFIQSQIRERKLEEDLLEAEYSAFVADAEFCENGNLLSVLAIPKAIQKAFTARLTDKYGIQFDKPLQARVDSAFLTARIEGKEESNALIAGGINFMTILNTIKKANNAGRRKAYLDSKGLLAAILQRCPSALTKDFSWTVLKRLQDNNSDDNNSIMVAFTEPMLLQTLIELGLKGEALTTLLIRRKNELPAVKSLLTYLDDLHLEDHIKISILTQEEVWNAFIELKRTKSKDAALIKYALSDPILFKAIVILRESKLDDPLLLDLVDADVNYRTKLAAKYKRTVSGAPEHLSVLTIKAITAINGVRKDYIGKSLYKPYMASIHAFTKEAINVLLDNDGTVDQRKTEKNIIDGLGAAADKHFSHRHLAARIVLDIILVLTVLGLLVHLGRKLTGRTYLFSTAETNRQHNFEQSYVNMIQLKA